jgi:hypothetical protein
VNGRIRLGGMNPAAPARPRRRYHRPDRASRVAWPDQRIPQGSLAAKPAVQRLSEFGHGLTRPILEWSLEHLDDLDLPRPREPRKGEVPDRMLSTVGNTDSTELLRL